MKTHWDAAQLIIGCLYLSDIFALHLRPLDFPFVSKDREQGIRNNLRQAETPDESNGIEKVCVAGTRIDPEVVEGRAQQGRVQDRGHGEKGIPHHCRASVSIPEDEKAIWAGLTGENVSIQWQHSKIQRRIRNARVRLEYCKDAQQCSDDEQRLRAKTNA